MADGVTECVMTLLLQSLWLISGEYIWRKPKFKGYMHPYSHSSTIYSNSRGSNLNVP